MCSLVHEDGVLIPIESAGVEADFLSVLADGDSLTSLAIGVLYIDVVELEVVFVHPQSTTGIVRPSLTSRNASLDGNLVCGI